MIQERGVRPMAGIEISSGDRRTEDERRPVPLLADHELRLLFRRSKGRLLVFNVEENPAVVERFRYHKDSFFKDETGRLLYDPDPKYGSLP